MATLDIQSSVMLVLLLELRRKYVNTEVTILISCVTPDNILKPQFFICKIESTSLFQRLSCSLNAITYVKY